ncbi:MAG: GNAT family N-acetyltransferase [Planctomycetota bacterium]
MEPELNTPTGDIVIRPSRAGDAEAVHALMRPAVMNRQILARTQAEIVELTRHGFVAQKSTDADADAVDSGAIIGFSAIEVYSSKLAELQGLVVDPRYQNRGIGRRLVLACIERGRELGIMEVLAISSSETFLQSCGFDFSLPDQKKALFCQLRPRPKDLL